ncbi:thiamine pyrophosphate-binding protein [Haladaptatus sp. NG-WS-4]
MKAWVADSVEALKRADVEFVAYLPDSKIAPLIEAVEADPEFETVLVEREETAVGILAGAWVGGRRGALLCQSSGLANSINAIASLTIPARIPFLGIVTRRGNLGEFNIAQVPGGYNLDRILDDLGVRNTVLSSTTDVEQSVQMAGETAFATKSPYIVLLEQTITGRKMEVESE